MPDFTTVGADGLVVRMEVPICLPELVLVELDTEGVLAVMELPIRDVRPRLSLLFELAFDLFDLEGVLAVMGLPIREVVLRFRPLLRLVLGALLEFDADGVRAVIELPMRELTPELIRLFELPLGTDLTDEEALREFLLEPEAVGLRVVIELPMREVMLRSRPLLRPVPGAFLEFDADGVRAVIELPMRELRLELMRLFELRLGTDLNNEEEVLEFLLELDTVGLRAAMELPIREVMLRLRLFPRAPAEFIAEGVREIRPEVIRLFELVIGLLPELDAEGAREVIVRLEMLERRLLAARSELDREEIDVLGLIVLTELFLLIDVERLGVRIERELMLLLRLRLIRAEELRLRLAIDGALTRGAGVLALGAGRLAELLWLEFELLASFFAAKAGSQRKIRAEMSVRIPILTAL